jgi:hypothetical protein
VGRGRGYTAAGFSQTPNHTGQTDEDGTFTLDQNPWDHVFIWGNNGVLLFRVTPGDGEPRNGFLDISFFNLAFWRGHEDHGRYTVVVR